MKQGNHKFTAADVARKKQEVSILAQSGQISKAKVACHALCKKIPKDPEIWFLMGAIYGQLSEFLEAERCCRKALLLAPQHPVLHFNLAIALLRQGNVSEAIPSFNQAIKLQPDFANAHLELGNARLMNDQPHLALECYRKAIELEPNSHIAIFNLGNACRDLGRMEDALGHYKQATLLAPQFPDAYTEAAATLISNFKFTRAIDLLESAIRVLPESPELFLKLAMAHQEQGDAAIALMHFKKVIELDKNNIHAQAGIAGILGMQGDYSGAEMLLDHVIATHPDDPTTIITYAHFAHRFGKTDTAINMVTDALRNGKFQERIKSKLHFSLAQLQERNDLIDTAFDSYLTGNMLRGAEFDYKSYQTMFNAITEYYSPAALQKLPRSSITSDTPVFIVGMPRSGTSLAEQIIASHPDVFGAGELSYINTMVDKLPQLLESASPYPHCLDALNITTLNQLADSYLSEISTRSDDARYVIDKMPLNYMHIGFIELLFPNARIIHSVRDPVDTCLSCFFKFFSGEHPYAYSLTDLGNYYCLYQQLMSHWAKVSSLPIYKLSYEQMVINQEQETRKIIEFCGLEWDDKCLDFHNTSRTVATASFDQVRQPIYSSAMGRWHAYEKHLGPLLAALKMDN